MAISQIPLRIAQVSDVHFGGSLSLPAEALDAILERLTRMEPDIVVLAGDLTTDGYEWEYEEAARWIEPPNAAQDEYPLMRALAERGENATRNSQARRQVLAAAAIVRFWSALPLEKPNRQEISRSRLIGPSLPALGWTRFRRRDADRGAA